MKELANHLHQKLTRVSGGVNSLLLVKEIVQERASWLECKKLKSKFDWENDGENMILVGVMQASEGSCQHAVTIYQKWVFDSNEEVPLCQESLDCCTWEVKDGKVTAYSKFVKFIDGWIFYEKDRKKEKKL